LPDDRWGTMSNPAHPVGAMCPRGRWILRLRLRPTETVTVTDMDSDSDSDSDTATATATDTGSDTATGTDGAMGSLRTVSVPDLRSTP